MAGLALASASDTHSVSVPIPDMVERKLLALESGAPKAAQGFEPLMAHQIRRRLFKTEDKISQIKKNLLLHCQLVTGDGCELEPVP